MSAVSSMVAVQMNFASKLAFPNYVNYSVKSTVVTRYCAMFIFDYMISHNFGNYILFPDLDCNRVILALNVDLHFDLDKILKRNNSDLNSFSVGILD